MVSKNRTMKKYVSNESKRTGDKTGDPSRLESGKHCLDFTHLS